MAAAQHHAACRSLPLSPAIGEQRPALLRGDTSTTCTRTGRDCLRPTSPHGRWALAKKRPKSMRNTIDAWNDTACGQGGATSSSWKTKQSSRVYLPRVLVAVAVAARRKAVLTAMKPMED